ncbi:MAG: glycosyltransferase family 39 protein [Acidimicrobiia bacterium]
MAEGEAPDESTGRSIGFGGWLAIVALVGFAARVWFVLAVRPNTDTRFDPALFHYLGLNLGNGLGYVRPPQMSGGTIVPTAEFGPVLPGLLAVATKLGLSTPSQHALVTATLGIGTVAVVGLLGKRVAGPRVGLVAAGIVALHPLLVQVDGAVMSESPYLLLAAGLMLATIRAWDEPSVGRWAVVGLLGGVAALTRAEGVALVVFVVVPAAAARAWPGWRRALAGAAVPALVGLAVVVPWTLRNWMEFDAFVPVSNNVGSVMLGSQCPLTYSGRSEGSWNFGCISTYAEADVRNRMGPGSTGSSNEAEVYGRWRNEGIRYALHHLDGFFESMPARLARTWGVYWHPSAQLEYDLNEARDHDLQVAGYVVALVLLPLAAFGGFTLHRRLGSRRGVLWILLGPVGVTLLLSAATYGTTRFRTIAEPTIAVLAAVTLVAGFERWQGARSGRATETSAVRSAPVRSAPVRSAPARSA